MQERKRSPEQRRSRRPSPPKRGAAPAAATSWESVAAWYDKLVGDEGSDYHRHVILPAALRMLDLKPGERVLDLCCGQGVLARLLAKQGVREVLAVDASPSLISSAKAHGDATGVRYVVADACRLGALADGTFDAAACVMAVQDVDNVEALFAGMGAALRTGGRAVVIMMHPCFRVPRQSTWGWDDVKKIQYRRLDAYASANTIPIATRPGGDPSRKTLYFHRPLAAYVNALGKAALAVTACEELLTHRLTEPGSRSRGENRARREFPLFLAMKAVKV
jgi:ubiquinone/menaquinone biosynthesis C-methylase UbiE